MTAGIKRADQELDTFVVIDDFGAPCEAEGPESPYEIAREKIKGLGVLATTYKVDQTGLKNRQVSALLTLADFSAFLEKPEEIYLMSWCDLEAPIQEVNRELKSDREGAFYSRIKETSLKVLAKISLYTLRTESRPFIHSPLWAAFLYKQDLIRLRLADLKVLSQKTLSVLRARLEEIQLSEDQKTRFLSEKIKDAGAWTKVDMSIVRMHLLSADEINKFASQLPREAFSLIATSKLSLIDFSKLEEAHIRFCMGGEEDSKDDLKARYASLSKEQRNLAVFHIDNKCLSLFPDECFEEFILESPEIVRRVYGNFPGKEEFCRRISLIPKERLNILIDLIPLDLWEYFPEDRIADLPYEEMRGELIQKIFKTIDSPQTRKRKFDLIPKEVLSSLVDKLPREYLSEFSDEEIRRLDYSKINNVHSISILLFSDTKENIKNRVSMFSQETFNDLLFRFSANPPFQLNGESFLRYANEEQIRGIDPQRVGEAEVSFLFPLAIPESVHPKANYSVVIDLTGAKHHVFQWPQSSICRSYKEEEMENILREKRETCKRNAAYFEGRFHLFRLPSQIREFVERK